ncbi:hypothetical protein [Cellulomonas triticagri]|uniref:Uncharacterized protein n=1 Tax=Cellulomonas triticagri TaxID=2483352 RepID=A0A3M2IY70_9CELL|nr:hypothetical protein [Cellulomonas triticagri]RMI06867.1 hypothetical protein EBM89_14820 [Cellulomonas triticagri]
MPPEEAAWRGRVLFAAADGIQLQWPLDPTIDMVADIVRLDAFLSTPFSVTEAGRARCARSSPAGTPPVTVRELSPRLSAPAP